MRLDVALVFTAVLRAVSPAGIPRNSPPTNRPYIIQQLRDEIQELEDVLGEALYQPLVSLLDLESGSTAPSTATSTSATAPSSTLAVTISTSVATASFGETSSDSTATTNFLATSASSSSSVRSQVTPSPPTPMANANCASLCSSLAFPSSEYPVSPVSCVSYDAGSTITVTGGQAQVGCGASWEAPVDLCRVVLTVATSEESETYMEVWLPQNGQWNGRTMNTDNGGINGCVHFVDMQYVAGRGFAAIGDNAGHNSSSFDGSWFADSNEVILDWAYRARHSAVVAGKEVVNQFYNASPEYSYYIGCSAGGAQGMKSAQMFPEDFDGIIAGSSAADFNHLQAWSGRFVQLTGTSTSDPRFLTENDWITVQAAIFDQCDARIDGVDDGILEDPTLCDFDSSVLSCTNNATLPGCLTDTQVSTVNEIFTELYNTDGELLFPALLYGSQVDAFRLGQLSGSVQAISEDWYKYAVVSDNNWDALDMDQADYERADELDAYHGNVSAFSGDLSGFRSAGGKMIMYHGMADPLVSGSNSQRYYLKVARTMGLSNTGLDDFYRLFRISGMAHCGVGGISGAGAWMFGQNAAASIGTHNIIDYLQDWVEHGNAPDTLIGTKFWYDTQSSGIQYERPHCRFPYRTTYVGGDAASTGAWTCELIEAWRDCAPGASPRLCNVDGSFS